MQFALIRLILEEYAAHYPFTLGGSEKFRFITEKTAGGNYKFKPCTRANRAHMQELALAVTHTLEHRARRVVGYVNDEPFHGLALYAVDFLEHDARGGNLKLVTFAAHIFNENRKVHFTPAAHTVAVRRTRFFNAQGYVFQKLFEKPVADMAGRDELAFPARKRAVVYGESHLYGRLGDFYEFVRFHAVGVAHGVADVYLFKPRKTNYIARFCRFALRSVKTFNLVKIGYFTLRFKL